MIFRGFFAAAFLSVGLGLSAAHAQIIEDPSKPVLETDVVQSFEIIPPDPEAAGVQKIKVTAVEVDPRRENLAAEELVARPGESVDAVNVIEFDDPQANPRNLRSRAARIFGKVRAGTSSIIRLSARRFEEWASRKENRMMLFCIEVVTFFGAKTTELVIGKMTMGHVPAIISAMLITTMVSGVEWKIYSVSKWLNTPGPKMAKFFERLSANAESEAARTKIQERLNAVWSFIKTSGMNAALFEITKIILYSAAHTDVAFLDHIVKALTEIPSSLLLGLGAAAVSFPTTRATIVYKDRMVLQAGADAQKKAGLPNIFRAYVSTALMARALLFCSMIVGAKFNAPALTYAAGTAIAGMTVFSFWEWFGQVRKLNACKAALNPEGTEAGTES